MIDCTHIGKIYCGATKPRSMDYYTIPTLLWFELNLEEHVTPLKQLLQPATSLHPAVYHYLIHHPRCRSHLSLVHSTAHLGILLFEPFHDTFATQSPHARHLLDLFRPWKIPDRSLKYEEPPYYSTWTPSMTTFTLTRHTIRYTPTITPQSQHKSEAVFPLHRAR